MAVGGCRLRTVVLECKCVCDRSTMAELRDSEFIADSNNQPTDTSHALCSTHINDVTQ